MNLYEELGVKPDATDAEIKSAYRRKAKASHPDIGGDPVEFAEAAKAYKVLSHPDLRLLYDATGQERRTPIEVEVQNILTQVFNEALASEKDIEVTAFVRNRLNDGARKIPAMRKDLEARQIRLEAKRGKITSKGINIAHMIIDGELKNITAQLANLDHQEIVNKACLAAMDEYSEEWEAPVETFSTMDLRRMQFGGQLGSVLICFLILSILIPVLVGIVVGWASLKRSNTRIECPIAFQKVAIAFNRPLIYRINPGEKNQVTLLNTLWFGLVDWVTDHLRTPRRYNGYTWLPSVSNIFSRFGTLTGELARQQWLYPVRNLGFSSRTQSGIFHSNLYLTESSIVPVFVFDAYETYIGSAERRPARQFKKILVLGEAVFSGLCLAHNSLNNILVLFKQALSFIQTLSHQIGLLFIDVILAYRNDKEANSYQTADKELNVFLSNPTGKEANPNQNKQSNTQQDAALIRAERLKGTGLIIGYFYLILGWLGYLCLDPPQFLRHKWRWRIAAYGSLATVPFFSFLLHNFY